MACSRVNFTFYLKIQGSRMVTCSKLRTQNTQISGATAGNLSRNWKPALENFGCVWRWYKYTLILSFIVTYFEMYTLGSYCVFNFFFSLNYFLSCGDTDLSLRNFNWPYVMWIIENVVKSWINFKLCYMKNFCVNKLFRGDGTAFVKCR